MFMLSVLKNNNNNSSHSLGLPGRVWANHVFENSALVFLSCHPPSEGCSLWQCGNEHTGNHHRTLSWDCGVSGTLPPCRLAERKYLIWCEIIPPLLFSVKYFNGFYSHMFTSRPPHIVKMPCFPAPRALWIFHPVKKRVLQTYFHLRSNVTAHQRSTFSTRRCELGSSVSPCQVWD